MSRSCAVRMSRVRPRSEKSGEGHETFLAASPSTGIMDVGICDTKSRSFENFELSSFVFFLFLTSSSFFSTP